MGKVDQPFVATAPGRIEGRETIRVRDGLIVESRDYADHLAFAAATGRLPALVRNTTPSG